MRVIMRAAVCLLLGMSEMASASVFSCQGVVRVVGVSDGGSITTDFGYGIFPVCSVTGQVDFMTVESCRSLYSMLLTAQTSGKSVRLHFSTSAPSLNGISSCSELGNWSWRVPYFAEIPLT